MKDYGDVKVNTNHGRRLRWHHGWCRRWGCTWRETWLRRCGWRPWLETRAPQMFSLPKPSCRCKDSEHRTPSGSAADCVTVVLAKPLLCAHCAPSPNVLEIPWFTEVCQIPPIVFLNKKTFLKKLSWTVEMFSCFFYIYMPFNRVLRPPNWGFRAFHIQANPTFLCICQSHSREEDRAYEGQTWLPFVTHCNMESYDSYESPTSDPVAMKESIHSRSTSYRESLSRIWTSLSATEPTLVGCTKSGQSL